MMSESGRSRDLPQAPASQRFRPRRGFLDRRKKLCPLCPECGQSAHILCEGRPPAGDDGSCRESMKSNGLASAQCSRKGLRLPRGRLRMIAINGGCFANRWSTMSRCRLMAIPASSGPARRPKAAAGPISQSPGSCDVMATDSCWASASTEIGLRTTGIVANCSGMETLSL